MTNAGAGTLANRLVGSARGPAAVRKNCCFVTGDSREVLQCLPDHSIHCILTSPPYAELKDYGADRQLGFGQGSHEEYLNDLAQVLGQLYRVAADGAAMWIVLDTVKSSGKTLLLPWETIHRAGTHGWRFQDLVIWDKGRSLPWSHIGRFRGVFEYVLLFSKNSLRRFALDQVRQIDHLSSYWVRYPERYNPAGKAPTDLWHFPIPVQGSWSRNGIRHYCPFPVSLVARMIALTTGPGETVLDPFAGTGTVPVVASYLGRQGLGIDVNAEFVRGFDTTGFNALQDLAAAELTPHTDKGTRSDLGKLIATLRILKSPRTLFSQLSRPDRLGNKARKTVRAFLVTGTARAGRSSSRPTVGRATIYLLAGRGVPVHELRRHVSTLLAVPPLSKFGLLLQVEVVAHNKWSPRLVERFPSKRWYVYTKGNFHRYSQSLSNAQLAARIRDLAAPDKSRFPPIVSSIRANVESPTPD